MNPPTDFEIMVQLMRLSLLLQRHYRGKCEVYRLGERLRARLGLTA